MVVWIDDVGRRDWDDCELPKLHRLEASGLSFSRAYANPYCSPTRFTAQFGVYGFRRGIVRPIRDIEAVAIPEGELTSLGQVFKDEGFATLQAGKWHLSSAPTMGADEFLRAPNLFGYDDALAWSRGNLALDGGVGHFEWMRYDNGVKSKETTYSATAIVDSARAWWRETSGPKFANVCFNTPHVPHEAPPRNLLPPDHPTPVTDREKYESALLALGTELERLLEVVDLTKTFVFVISDNGTPGSVARVDNREKGSIYEGGIHVPMFVLGPGIAPGTDERLVHTVDLQATLIELLGFEHVAPSDGVSFASSLSPEISSTPERDWVYCERGRPNGPRPFKKWFRTIRHKDGYKLTVREVRGEIVEELWLLPNENEPVIDAKKSAELRAIMDAVTD